MDVYLGVVLLHPTKKAKDEEAAMPTIVVPLQCVLAKDEGHAAAKLLRMVPEEHANKDAQLEVKTLSFRSAPR